MITKLDIAVIRYLRALGGRRPDRNDDTAWAAYLDGLDRLRFEVLDVLIRKPRYARSGGLAPEGRRLWRTRDNPHRPPLA